MVPVLAWAARPLEAAEPGTIRPGKAALEVSVDYEKSHSGTVTGGKGTMGIGLLPGLGDSLVGVKHRLLTVGLRLGAVYPL